MLWCELKSFIVINIMTEDSQIKEYENLSKEIQDTINSQDEMYREIQGVTVEGNQKYKLEGRIEDLKERRNNIFKFLQDKYNQNTTLRKKYFEELVENKKVLENQENEIESLQKKIKSIKQTKDTNTRQVNIEKYERNKNDYYYNLYIMIVVVLVLLVVILHMIVARLISKGIGMNIVMGILLLSLVYIVYYVYFNNYNRDEFHWDKLYFPEPKLSGSQCQEIISEEDEELAKLEELATQKIKDFNMLSCVKKQ